MNYTQHYQLPQWVDSDRILRTDFNDMASKLDAALKSNADALSENTAAVSAKGNCQIVSGSYVGSGLAGAAYPTSLTFDKKPLAVFIMPTNRYGSSNSSIMMVRGAVWCQYHPDGLTTVCTVNWGETSVSWYHANGEAQSQFSTAQTYCYIALLSSEE